tara:strand:- start:14427 stop:15215 length:789 start_codon:yes stop_codon:yes gene_type:complete
MECYNNSIIGRRESNEDKHKILENLNGTYDKLNHINFYAIFDGHGGKEVSTFLEKYLYKYFLSSKINYNDLHKLKYYIKKIYEKIDSKLYSKLKKTVYQTGSTALVSILHNNNNNCLQLYLINLGDCRAIICNKNNKAKQLTEDHKPNTSTEKKRISDLGGKIYYDGYDWRVLNLSVSRAFGDFDSKPYITHIPEIYRVTLNKHDKFMVMACDGLWDVMTNQDVVDFILKHIDNKKNIAKLLTQEAYNKGSQDNISVIIKFF